MQPSPNRRTFLRWLAFWLTGAWVLFPACMDAAPNYEISGRVMGAAGNPIKDARIQLEDEHGAAQTPASTDSTGDFLLTANSPGRYQLTASVAGFVPAIRPVVVTVDVARYQANIVLNVGATESILVTSDPGQTDLLSPDPAERVLVRQDLLEANPGRAGAPVSIPGGIKAPQYFAPGVAGDHGEPIAQYLALGGYLVPSLWPTKWSEAPKCG